MAGDWIKMRGELLTHPRFLSLCSALIYRADPPGLLVYVCGADALDIGVMPPRTDSVTERALRIVTERALRDVTALTLLRVWCAVNSHCKVRGSDAVMKPMSLSDLDDVAGFEGFAEALKSVGWVRPGDDNSLLFPNFLEFNEPACLRRIPKTNAERQRLFRKKHPSKQRPKQRVTRSNESNAREEKRREEEEANASSSAPGEPAKKKPARSPPKPRERNALFDALAEITGSDPHVTGSHVGRVRALLANADPPYTPEEVRDFGQRFPELCDWAAKEGRTRPTLGEVEKYIGRLRNPEYRTAPRGPRTTADRLMDQVYDVLTGGDHADG